MIDSLIKGKKHQSAFWIFSEVSEEIGADVCNSLLASLASNDLARQVFDKMLERGVALNTIGFGVFIWRLSKNTEPCKILGVLDEAKNSASEINGSVIAVLVIHGLCNASRELEALWVLDELRIRGCKPDFIAYRIVAEAFRLTGNAFEREVVLKKKRKLGVAPRTNDYREFILELISKRLICEARDLGEVIVSGNFPIEDDVLNSLIESVSAVDPVLAIMFLKFMIQKGRFPTLLTLSNFSRNLCQHKNMDELVDVYNVLSFNDYFTDLERYDVMVSFLCKGGRVKEAYAALQEMKKKGLVPNVSFYNCLMEACCRDDLVRPAKRLWDEMFAGGCAGNLKTYNILISKLSQIGEVEEAQHLYHHMVNKGVVPDATTYTALLEGLCDEPKLETAFEIFKTAAEQDLMLAQSILSTFVLHICKKGHFRVASDFLHGMNSDIRNVDSHVVLLKYLADANEVQLGIEHAKKVRETSPSLLRSIVNKVVAASHSSSSRSEPFLSWLQSAGEKCLDGTDNFRKDLHGSYAGYL